MQNDILNKLLDKYERSILSKRGSALNLKIEIKPKQILGQYGNSQYFKETLVLDAACDFLESRGYIFTRRDENFIKMIGLNLDHLQDAYIFIKRTPKERHQDSVRNILQDIDHPASQYLQDKLNRHESIARYVDIKDIKFLEDMFKLIKFIELTTEPISYRKASQRLFNDSKRLSSIERNTLNLLKDSKVISTSSNLFEISTIYKNKDFIYLKGSGRLSINKTNINLEDFKGGFALSTDDIYNIKWDTQTIPTVLSIENLTSFHDTYLTNTLIVYLAGYHNTLKETFFINLYENYPNANYLHFGDLDAGGFEIFYNLIHKTNIPFNTFKMNQETLLKYENYTKPLSQNDKTKLRKLYTQYQLPVIELMLQKGIKLEQEIIDVCY